jgi:hypothetical protein
VPKTDETRLQSVLGVLNELAGKDFYVTTKLDGMSATYFRNFDGELVVCSRNWVVKPAPGDVYHAMASLRPRPLRLLPRPSCYHPVERSLICSCITAPNRASWDFGGMSREPHATRH